MRGYEVMIILDSDVDERTVAPTLDKYFKVVKDENGTIDNVDYWGKRRLAYDIKKRSEGIYVVVNLTAAPATVKELDRQLNLSESVLRTKVLRPDAHRSASKPGKAPAPQK
ncbi:MAG TPA: 30S ribosomal protein S6 [Actinomycetaceae bacterium]|nr:30S ribosomal protein S6 [Actinomycetaceae bacterium]